MLERDADSKEDTFSEQAPGIDKGFLALLSTLSQQTPVEVASKPNPQRVEQAPKAPTPRKGVTEQTLGRAATYSPYLVIDEGFIIENARVAMPRDGLPYEVPGKFDELFNQSEDSEWQEGALCAQTDPEEFFPEKGESTKEAKRICQACGVREACLQHALDNDERFGVWGGLSERERRKLKKR